MDRRKRPSAADMELVGALYQRYMGIMYKTALENLDDDALKDAVVHDALIRLAHKADTLRGLDANAAPVYIASVVRFVALEARRKQRRERKRVIAVDLAGLEGIPSGASMEDELAEREAMSERLQYMWEALGELSEPDRELLIGKYAAGRSDEDLARALGIKPDSVRKKLSRARERAKRLILRKEAARSE